MYSYHIHDPDRLDPRPRGLDAEQARGLAALEPDAGGRQGGHRAWRPRQALEIRRHQF